MAISAVRENGSRLLEWLAMALAAAAIASGMVLGGGGSAFARGVFIALAAASLTPSILSMIVAGRLRIVRSALWVPILAVLSLGTLHLLPGVHRYFPSPIPQWLKFDPTYRSTALSVNRAETIAALAWLLAASVLAFVISAHVRTWTRVKVVASALALVLAITGTVGFVQTLAGRPALIGFVSPDKPTVPTIMKAIYSGSATSGLVEYVGWTFDSAQPSSAMFVPRPEPVHYFGGLVEASQWAGCVVVILPILLAAVVYLAGFAGVAGFRTHGQTKFATALWVAAVSMAAGASWFIDPIVVPVVSLGSTALIVSLVGREMRRRAIRWCGFAMFVLAVVLGVRFSVHGNADIGSRYVAWRSNSRSILEIVHDYPWLGCGLGAARDLWPRYAASPAPNSADVSTAILVAAEIGLVGVGVLLLSCGYVVGRAAWVYRSLDNDGKTALAGFMAAFSAMIALALSGNLLASPAAMGVCVFVVACLARALAGGFQDEEALFPS